MAKRHHNDNMKQTAFIILLTFISNITFGQTDLNKRKSIYLEIAGSGGLGSINYEKLFYKKNNTEFTWRAGLSFAPIDKNNGTGIVFPFKCGDSDLINSVFKKNNMVAVTLFLW